MRVLVLCALAWCAIGSAYATVHAATYCVSTPGELTAALSVAARDREDDVIQVVQGTYTGNFLYFGNFQYFGQNDSSLTIRGGYTAGCTSRVVDPANTILDGNATGSALSLYAGDFAVDGLTLQNGLTPSLEGGGLRVYGASAVNLTNNVFRGNTATVGGGLRAVATTVSLTNNTFSGNTASSGPGGGAYVYAPNSASLTNNTFSGNTAPDSTYGFGGGLYLVDTSTATLTSNTFSGNTAFSAGGVFVDAGTAMFSNNTLRGNTASNIGGLYVIATTASLTNNVITDNAAISGSAGGVYVSGDQGYLPAATITNNTISRNTALAVGGGLYVFQWSSGQGIQVDIYNNIVWGNSAQQGADLFLDNDGDGDSQSSVINLFNNDFDWSTIQITVPFPIDPSNLNNLDPRFVDAINGDYHLQASSPVIDKGSNRASSILTTDQDGNSRIADGDADGVALVDMGAYEFGASPPRSCLGTGVASLSGRVRNGYPSYIPGVTLTLRGTGGCSNTTTTKPEGPDGIYQFPMLGRGTYTVTPSKVGCTFTPPIQTVTITDRGAWAWFITPCPYP